MSVHRAELSLSLFRCPPTRLKTPMNHNFQVTAGDYQLAGNIMLLSFRHVYFTFYSMSSIPNLHSC
jgi:hypothetical protein